MNTVLLQQEENIPMEGSAFATGSNIISQDPQGGSIMGVGGGIHDDAVDVTYSTKPDNPQVALGTQAVTTTTTTTSTAQYGFGAGEETTGLDLGATVGNTVN